MSKYRIGDKVKRKNSNYVYTIINTITKNDGVIWYNAKRLKDNGVEIFLRLLEDNIELVSKENIDEEDYSWLDDLLPSETTTKQNKKEEEVKEMRTEKIVDLYFERAMEREKKLCHEADKEVIKNDELQIELRKMLAPIEELLVKNDMMTEDSTINKLSYDFHSINVNTAYSSVTRSVLSDNDNDCRKIVAQLGTLKEEVRTMLSGCETYDDEMRVLSAYGIVDENGKLNEYKAFGKVM